MNVKICITFRKILQLVVHRLQLHGAGAVLGPLVPPEVILPRVLVHVRPLRVQLVHDGVEHRRVERVVVVAVKGPVRAAL